MNVKRYCGLLNMFSKPFYSFFRGRERDFNTLNDGEIFLSRAKKFNDKFEGRCYVDPIEFQEEYLRLKVGDRLYNEIIERFKFCNDADIISALSLVTSPSANLFPRDTSSELREFLCKYEAREFEAAIKRKYHAYCREIERVRNSFGIKCFTTVPPQKNSVMWVYYGNDYEGFNCEFSLHQIAYDIPSTRCDEYGKYICEHFYRVKYVKNFDPNIKIDCCKLLKIPVKKVYSSPYIIRCVKHSLLIKQSQWGHEKEIRLIIRDNDPFIKIKACGHNGFKVRFPYVQKIYYCGKRDNKFFISRASNIAFQAKKLAHGLSVDSIELIPSQCKNEFCASPASIIENEVEYSPIDYSQSNIPF